MEPQKQHPEPSAKEPEAQPSEEANRPTVIGIGASAGGLKALKAFFAHVPEENGLAFVVVVHLSPEHESHLADLLQPHVKMPVMQVTDEPALEPNRVYVIPPGQNLDTIDTHLRLTKLEERRIERAPIDHFFRALAGTHDGHSVGVILTGTGADGTLGIKEIKEKGGLTVVQDPNEAEYDGMPQSAIATGLVDLVLPVAEMPEKILRFARTRPRIAVPEDEKALGDGQRQTLQKIFAQIRARTGRDFTRYKRSTILRRIQRRMQLAHIEELADYLAWLRDEPNEVRALADDFLITVTNFFRDPEVAERLETDVIPQLFEGKGPGETVRVWSVGCATGEEAYSVAMLLLEEAARHEAPPEIQIFASDLHEHSLQKAREGFYPGDIETDVSAERLRRFFIKENVGYRIRKEVREHVVFAPHNLLGDPPFSKLDLIACRNVLIYLQREVQRDVLDLFHYALNPDGFLVLGTSETVDRSELFRTESKPHCIFRKRNVPAPEPQLPVFPITRVRPPGEPAERNGQKGEPLAYGSLHQRMVEWYAPPSLLVNPDYQVVHFSEHVGRFLVHPGGEPTTSVFKLVREELRIELRAALHAAKEKGQATRSKPIAVAIEGVTRSVVLSAQPAQTSEQEGFVLVLFDEAEVAIFDGGEADPPAAEAHGGTSGAATQDGTLREMEAELAQTKQRLQAIIEEYETGQEEMRASNEEMQSTNEELRSTLEELETSKEELQSMNEELQTLNQENKHKVEELSQLSGDLQNLMAATAIPILFLDRRLRILRFTPQVEDLFNIRLTDRGRPLSDITHRLGYDDLRADAEKVLRHLVPVEREVQDEAGRWYLTRVRPYRSTDDRIEGVVITFVDITKRKQSEENLRQSEERYRLLVENVEEYAIFMVDVEGRIATWNTGAEDLFGYTEQEACGLPLARIFTEEDRTSGLPEKERATAARRGKAADERWHVRKDGSRFWASGVMTALRGPDESLRGFAKILRDNTQRKASEEALRAVKERLDVALGAAWIGTHEYDVAADRHYLDPRAQAIIGTEDPFSINGWLDRVHPDDLDQVQAAAAQALDPAGEGLFDEEYRITDQDGTDRWVYVRSQTVFTENGEGRHPVRVYGAIQDMTVRREVEEALRESEARFRAVAETVPNVLFTATSDGKIDYISSQVEALLGTSRKATLGTSLWPGMIHPDDRERAEAMWDEATGKQTPYEVRYRLRHADGSYRWVIVRARPFYEEDGTLDQWFGTITDVHALTEAEEALRLLNETLEARIEQRTAQVRQLASKLTRAEQAERRRISQILHDDLQQRLYGVHLKMSFIRRDAEAGNQERLAKNVSDAEAWIDAAIGTTRQLTVDLSPPVLKTEGLVDALGWLVVQMKEMHNLEVEIKAEHAFYVPDEDLRVLLFQILRELLFNAVKHAGTDRATIALQDVDDHLAIRVIDEGHGFDVEAAAARAEQDGGFGLFSVRERLNLVGGRMEIDSAPGKGTRVTLHVPGETTWEGEG